MKQKILFVLILLPFMATAQNISKNKINFLYSPSISKTNFDNLENISSHYFKKKFRDNPPGKPIFGYTYGISLERSLITNWDLSLGFQYSRFGQQSYTIFSKPDDSINHFRIYYKSYEIPLILKRTLRKKNKTTFFCFGGILLNVHSRVITEDFRVKSIFEKKLGCCRSVELHVNENLWNELRQHIELGLWKVGAMVGTGVVVDLHQNISFTISPKLAFYPTITSKNKDSSISSGNIYVLGCDLSTNIKF